MSRRPYECFKCRDSGYPNTMVFLAGKDDAGRTIQLEEDGTKHVHKTKQQHEVKGKEKENPLARVSDESVDRGITAFSMMSDLIKKVEQMHNLMASMDGKLDRLLNLAERK